MSKAKIRENRFGEVLATLIDTLREDRERGIVSTIDHPLIERARTSRVAVADLVGFSIEPLGDGRALGWLEALVHESCGLKGPDRDSRDLLCTAATLKG